jgi:hypothetical protein
MNSSFVVAPHGLYAKFDAEKILVGSLSWQVMEESLRYQV